MMRSLFSAVAGLKTHQTRMDVIGNNIANVNTTAYKSQSMVFNDLLYQTTQDASGANSVTGRGGTNARQIGLGAKTSAIKTAITQQGSAQSTNDPFDIMITGEAFFIVSDGSTNFFTRDGSFTVDGSGNLVMTSTGYTVMGWQVDDEGNIVADTVSALRVMDERNLIYPAESTTRAYFSGIVDENDTNVNGSSGRIVTLEFFDRRGYSYTAKFSIHSTDTQGGYTVELDDILDSTGVSLVKRYNLNSIRDIANFGGELNFKTTALYNKLEDVILNTDGTYSRMMSAESVLNGNFTMVNMANEWKITTAPGQLAADADVTIKGKITLDVDTLQREPYNLICEKDKTTGTYKYYTKQTDAQGNVIGTTEVTNWGTTLSALGFGTVQLATVDMEGNAIPANNNPQIDSTTGAVTLIYDATFKTKTATTLYDEKHFITSISDLEAFGLENSNDTTYNIEFKAPSGNSAQITKIVDRYGNDLVFDVSDGEFSYVGSTGNNSVMLTFNPSTINLQGQNIDLSMFTDIDIDFSALANQDNGGTSTTEATSGGLDNPTLGCGRRLGEMIGISIGQDGVITASYDNGQHKNLGQIAVATFANASGLSKGGDNLYSETINSGYFDGVGQDITADGSGYMTSGVLEMSNVDLSQEFTEMITTQRGFQANSRIISVSDNLLEELVNLKR